MSSSPSTDYETYKQVMDELMRPIAADGLDDDTLKRLYESKLVYLENLREKCFWEINTDEHAHFTSNDHALILSAISQTRRQLTEVIRLTIVNNLSRCKVS